MLSIQALKIANLIALSILFLIVVYSKGKETNKTPKSAPIKKIEQQKIDGFLCQVETSSVALRL